MKKKKKRKRETPVYTIYASRRVANKLFENQKTHKNETNSTCVRLVSQTDDDSLSPLYSENTYINIQN